ncbi:EamA family transporter RarD [Aneurinibacillus tyrosinisolvens]|uniref:EamA family transporter RarD n=1 Tax=Aneurinibacillus tyrosinisolvens TaxID=1443435 RepID=UPI0009E607B1|nr:EamA family transporter RarD [Aneurinibacillus tyrosinisolvens]
MSNETDITSAASRKAGIWYVFVTYVVWGLLPLYWHLLKDVPSGQILAHRIFWSFIFVAILLFFYKRWGQLKEAAASRTNRLSILACSLLISANWFIYIWAVNNNHVIETSMGYYINPLFSVALGLIVLKERLSRVQIFSLVLAAIGVAIMVIQFGKMPWIALSLAVTFGFYGLAKKMLKVDAMVGLALETIFVMPVALFYLASLETSGTGAFGQSSLGAMLLMIGSGVATALPLLWFAEGAKRVPLSTMGFIQYVSPTITLTLGVFIFKEAFTATHAVSFGFIWCGLLLYSLSYTKFMHGLQAKSPKKPGQYRELTK